MNAFTTDTLLTMKDALRSAIRLLEQKSQFATVEDTRLLKQYRADQRRVTCEINKRHQQLRLF